MVEILIFWEGILAVKVHVRVGILKMFSLRIPWIYMGVGQEDSLWPKNYYWFSLAANKYTKVHINFKNICIRLHTFISELTFLSLTLAYHF